MNSSVPKSLVVRLAYYPQLRLILSYFTSPCSGDDYYCAKVLPKYSYAKRLTRAECDLQKPVVEVFANKLTRPPEMSADRKEPILSFRETDFYIDKKDVPALTAWIEQCHAYDQRHQEGTSSCAT